MTTNKIYVSSSGNDVTGNGTIEFPYATLTKVSAVVTNSTSIFIEKGSIFYGDELILSNLNNIKVNAYGVGDNPIMSGVVAVTGWSNLGANIWSFQDDNFPDEITNLFIGGYKAILGRLPETAFKTATSGDEGVLTDSTRTEADGYWDGCEIVVRYYDWATGISRVSNYANKTFNFPQYHGSMVVGNRYHVKLGTEYFLQNHIACVNAQDEWCYNNTTKTIYLYSTSEPSSVTASYGSDAVYINNCKHVSIQNLTINGSQRCGIYVTNSSSVTFNLVNFNYSGMYAILATYGNWLKITNCTGLNQNTDFCNVLYYDNLIIEDNTALYSGVDQGACRYIVDMFPLGGSGGMTGHFLNNCVIRNNHSAYSAYCAIAFNFGTKFLFEKNYTHHFNLNKYDGGGVTCNTATFWHLPAENLYPQSTGLMYKNIITDGNLPENSYGLYVDNYTQNFESAKNFVSGCRWNYILHESIRNHCHDNMSIQENGTEAGVSYGMTFPTTVRGVIENNTFVSPQTDAPSFFSISKTVNPNTVRGNTYCYPLGKLGTGGNDSINQLGSSWYDMTEWAADESRVVWERTNETEITPSVSPGLLPKNDFVFYSVNPSKISIEVESTDLPFDDYINLNGTAISFPVTVLANSYAVFVRAPRPTYYKATVTAGSIKQIIIQTTVRLNESIVPATSAFAIAGKTISTVSLSANTIILTTAEDNVESDNLTIVYTKPAVNPITAYYGALEMATFTGSANLALLILTSTGTGAGVSTLRIRATADTVMTLDGNGKFYDDAACTINEGTTRTCTLLGALQTFYIKCTSGSSNFKFDNADNIYQFYTWTSGTNACSMGGNLNQFHNLTTINLSGNNTLSGDIGEFRDVLTFAVQGTPTLTGTTRNLLSCNTFTVASSSITYDFSRMKKLVNVALYLSTVFSSAEINQMLADLWLNRDQWRLTSATTRSADLKGHATSGAPTGQGIVDKLNLSYYRTPHNNTRYSKWTILTR